GGGGWEAVYVDLRQAVDLCHRDGSIKKRVAQDPGKYLHPDPTLVPLLESLRAGGKKLFLATNSLWDYSDVVMRWLMDGQTAARARDEGDGPRWLRYFDAVLTGCGKPHFFTQRRELFRVDTRTMALYNQQEGSPMTVDDGANASGHDSPGAHDPPRLPQDGSPLDGQPAPARVFQGGSYQDLHRLLGVTSGSQVLYAGDHIYGDVLRSKRDLGWRTMLVIPELRAELRRMLDGGVRDMEALRAARAQLDACEEELHLLRWQEAERGREKRSGFSAGRAGSSLASPPSPSLEKMQERCREMRLTHRRELQRMHRAFHPIWGALLKAGYKNSRYARQVERYACLYTSHVANLAFYSPEKSWMARMDVLAHEEEPCFSRKTLKAREDQ
ncbi:5' nucleotidase, partial [Helicosporidium sp. ATCC 50920]